MSANRSVSLFAVRGKSSQILFYVYRPAGADPFGKKCTVGVEGRIGGRSMRAPDIRTREITFQKDSPIKLSLRQVGQNVTLSINNENVGRFHERSLRPGEVGVYGKSQHGAGSPCNCQNLIASRLSNLSICLTQISYTKI